MRKGTLVNLVTVLVALLLAGCSGGSPHEDPEGPAEEVPPGVYVHGPDGLPRTLSSFGHAPARFEAVALRGEAWEPTIGAGPDGTVHYGAREWGVQDHLVGARTGQRVVVLTSADGGDHWQESAPHIAGTRNHFGADPYLHVDERTGRVFVADLYGACMMLSWSDDQGSTWTSNPIACGDPVNDHQSVFTGPPPDGVSTDGYPGLVFVCANDLNARVHCSTSRDGGTTFGPSVAVFVRPGGVGRDDASEACAYFVKPMDANAYSPVPSGHGAVASTGNAHLGIIHCGEVHVATTTDGGQTWSAVLVEDASAPVDGFGSDAQVAVDGDDVVYVLWLAEDALPHVAYSRDAGVSWSLPIVVAPAAIKGANFPTLTAGDPGRVAWGYYGTTDGTAWDAYIGVSPSLTAEMPIFSTSKVDAAGDPLARGSCQGRCNGVGDFLGMTHEPASGRIWMALVDVCTASACPTQEGEVEGSPVVARQTSGVSLRSPSPPQGP